MIAKKLLFSLLALCLLTTVDSLAQNEDQGVAQAVEKLRKLMIDPDKAGLEAIASDRLSYGHSSGKVEDKAAFVEALTSGASDFKSIELTDQTITVVDNTALVRHKLTGETIDKGNTGQVKIGVLLVWVKQKNDWKLLARQAVKVQ
ncbi:nuclear transport factor 2 family protein [Spirosoma oryzicola]|uniref:nuclear transport factor 2 family protein n=1 Tax=Spirosoma oryzicola TaxID=2898794 RepID=UPI001E29502F|nr:nuclear transport factor 2 family protein [Spirosoma oryzicola]UHG92462.1 nuclear transport factor 2 family protein [Spirosoma oryzicola]